MATHAYTHDRQPMEQVTASLTTKADKIRALFRAGYSRSEIAQCLGIRYQHAYNVLVRSGYTETQLSRPLREKAAAPEDSRREQVRATLGPGGRVVIPAEYREALQIKEGDAVFMRLDGDELRVVSDATEVRQVREMIAGYVPEGASLVDDLIRERRREVKSDSGA